MTSPNRQQQKQEIVEVIMSYFDNSPSSHPFTYRLPRPLRDIAMGFKKRVALTIASFVAEMYLTYQETTHNRPTNKGVQQNERNTNN